MKATRDIAVVGLGYVGLSLAVALGKTGKYKVMGFDKKKARMAELKKNHDGNYEETDASLKEATINFVDSESELSKANFYIIAVPTPVDNAKQPDLTPLRDASALVGKYLKKGDVVVYESTVYPGATEEDCLPVLEQVSGLRCGTDFKLAYSPERVSPGETQHTVISTVKIISAQDEETLDLLDEIYSSVVKAGLYRAPNIKVAEASKVIENAQRDINISFMNEIALILHKLNISTEEVLKAAATKWNFLPFKPGLVGGHCIGIDPYYLIYKAEQKGYYPDIILSGRRVNDLMGKFIAEQTIKNLIKIGTPIKHCKIAVLGITFKEDCADTRNSRVMDVIRELETYGVEVLVNDPVINRERVEEEFNLKVVELEDIKEVEAIILAVAHKQYVEMDKEVFKKMLNNRGVIMDVKNILNPQDFEGSGIFLWRL